MSRGLPYAPKWAWVSMAVLFVALAALLTFTLNRLAPASEPPRGAEAPTATPTAHPAPALTLPGPGASVLFFGDSYTAGYGAKPATAGYAYLVAADMGWEPTIDAISGTGYLDPGEAGVTYVQRIAELPDISPELVVLQGGLNDQDASPTRPQMNVAATAVVDGIRAKYPAAQIVLFGPVPPRGDPSRELTIVDDALHRVAIDKGIPWISPVGEHWDVSGHLIDDNTHPDNEGYRCLADQVVHDLRALAGA